MADLLPAQVQAGLGVAALVHDHSGGRLPAFSEERGVRVWRVPTLGRLLYAPLSPRFPFWLDRILDEFQPDLLHLHMPNTSCFWALLSRKARRLPWVIHWHSDVVASGFDRRLALAYPFYRPFERALLSRAATIVATSPPYRDTSVALRGWKSRTEIVPLGIDHTRLPKPTESEHAWAKERWRGGLRLLTVGRLTYYKGHELLLRVVARTPGVSLVLVGEGELRPRLESLVEELGLADRVWLAGRRSAEELGALMQGCDLFCLPSLERTEAFGVVLMEAMAQGRPCLVSAIEGSGVGWVIRDGENGYHLPVGDEEAWSGCLAKLAAEPERLRPLADNAREQFESRFRIEEVAERLSSVYRGIV